MSNRLSVLVGVRSFSAWCVNRSSAPYLKSSSSTSLFTRAYTVRPEVLCISSLRAMLRRWVMTVWVERYSCCAISLFVCHLTTSTSISFSRSLNCSLLSAVSSAGASGGA